MKILLLTDGIFPYVVGGMQKHSHYLARFLALQGHHVKLVHCVSSTSELPTQQQVMDALELPFSAPLESIPLRFPPAGYLPGHYLKESYIYSKNIYSKVQSMLNEFDIIYAKGFTAWHLLHLKTQGKNMPPVAVKFHGYEMFQPANTWRLKLEAWLLRSPVKWNNRHADAVFSYGGKITSLIQSLGVQPKRIKEVPTGIDATWFAEKANPPKQLAVQFVFIGRYERRKGIEELNAVLAQMINTHDFHFHFIGPIPQSKRIVSEKITYHGQLTDKAEMQSILDRCDVLVTPSHSEGMPNVIMEAMARGLAVVATPVGAVPVVVNESNGWLLPPADAVSLAQTLKSICHLPSQLIAERKKVSLQHIRAFNWEQIAKLTVARMEEVVEIHPKVND